MSGTRLFLLCAMLMLLAFLTYDNVTSGDLHISDATLSRRDDEKLTISLPYESTLQANEFATVSFKYTPSLIDGGRILTLAYEGCLVELFINEQQVMYAQGTPCIERPNIQMPDELLKRAAPIRVRALFSFPKENEFTVSLQRVLISGLNSNIAYMALVLYAVSVLFIRERQTLRRFNYGLAVVLPFLLSFAPWQSFGALSWWTGYMNNGLAIASLFLLLPLWAPARRGLGWLGGRGKALASLPLRPLLALMVVGFFALTVFLSQHLFGGLPHVADTHAQYMQAKIFASGKLYEKSHGLPQFFDFQYTINDGKYYSIFFPGHSLLLALGILAGAPWLINPLLGALTVLAVFGLGREIGGRAVGLTAAALLMMSPLVLVMSSEYMSHSTCLLMLTTCLWAYLRLIRTEHYGFALLAGFCAGFSFLARVQATVPFVLPIALHALWYFGSQRLRFSHLLLMAIGALPSLGFFFYNNYELTGNVWHTGYDIVTPHASDFWKRWGYWSTWDNLLAHYGRIVSDTELRSVHGFLLGWPTSSLLLIFLLFITRAQKRFCGLLIACFIAQCLGNLFLNYYISTLFPPRFYYESFGVLLVLIALCLYRIPFIVRALSPLRYRWRESSGAVIALVATLTAVAIPTRIADMYDLYSHNYWEGNAGYYRMLMNNVSKPALVFMKNYEEYRTVYFTLPPKDDSEVIFALDKGWDENIKLMRYYPNRQAYIADGDRLTTPTPPD